MNAETTTRILAIILAVFLWAYVHLTQNAPEINRTIADVPVKVTTPAGYSWELKPGDNTVDVYIKGPADVVNSILREDIHATVDATISKPHTETRLPVRVTLPRGAHFAGRLPTVTVTTVPLARKSFPVAIAFTALPAAGTVVGDYLVDPSLVTVEGPQELLEQINQVVVRLDPTELLTTERDFVPRAVNAEGERVSGVVVLSSTIKVSMGSLTTPNRSRQLAVRPPDLTGQPHGRRIAIAEINPDVVTISGDPSALDQLKGYLECESLSVHDVEEDTIRTVRLRVPDGLTVAGAKSIRVHLTVSRTR